MNVRLLGLDGVSIRELTDEEIADLMQGMSASKGELFHYSWHNGPRSSIDAGCAALDGQVIQYANNPVVCQDVWDGKQNAVLEENWAANKNCWSRGDGATWVRVPNLNMADGSGKPFYLRGGPASLNGTWVGDAARRLNFVFSGSHAGAFVDAAGMLSLTAPGNYRFAIETTTKTGYNTVTFDSALSTPTADENRVKTAYGVWVVRVFTEVSNTGAIDAATLATQLGVLDVAVQSLEGKIDNLEKPIYAAEALWTGAMGSLVEVSLSREVQEGESLTLKFVNPSSSLSHSVVYMPSIAHVVDGGQSMSFVAGTVQTAGILRKPALAGSVSTFKFTVFTSGWSVAGIYAVKRL